MPDLIISRKQDADKDPKVIPTAFRQIENWANLHIYSHVYRGNAWTTTATGGNFQFDSVDSGQDVLGLYDFSIHNFRCPVSGVYTVTSSIRYTPTAVTQWMQLEIIQNGTNVFAGPILSAAEVAGGGGAGFVTADILCSQSDTIGIFEMCSTNGLGGSATELASWATFALRK